MGNKKAALVFYAIALIFIATRIFADTQTDVSAIPPPEKFVATWETILGMLAGVLYKGAIGTFKNLVRRRFSWKKLIYPIVITLFCSFPTIIFLLPHLAAPSGKFLPDFLYSFIVAFILVDVGSDLDKLREYMIDRQEKKSGEKELSEETKGTD